MFYKTLKFIAIISVILYFSAFCYLRLKHPFWFSQPVTQYTDLFKIEGIITENIPKPIIINSFKVQFINTMESKNIEQIKQLLNNNYNVDESYRFNYDQKYLNWSINVPYKHYNIKSKNNWSLGIYDNNQLIAFINGKPIDLYLNNKNLPSFYIDYLCIDTKYRKKNLAQSIITQMANNGFVDYFKIFIFKKDLFPLPFKYLAKYNYYIIETKKIKRDSDYTKKINSKNIKEGEIKNLYNFYIKDINNHQLYNKFHYEEFKHYLNNENISFYCNKGNNKIEYLVGIYDSKINYNNTKTSEFLFVIINDKNKYNQIINEILSKESYKYNYSLINDTSNNEIYIEQNNLEKISNCYLHFYNYYYDKIIKNSDIFFNIP